MIIFQLKCKSDHQFEGWFSDSGDYEKQKAAGLLTCPICDSRAIVKVLTGVPHLKSTGKKQRPEIAKPKQAPVKLPAEQATNIDAVTLVKLVNDHVKKNFVDVGDKFADKAVKMNKGEIPQEKIYGTMNKEQKEHLEDNGVPYAVLPQLGPEFDN